MTTDLVARLPDRFWSVPYVGARFPGSSAVAERPDLAECAPRPGARPPGR